MSKKKFLHFVATGIVGVTLLAGCDEQDSKQASKNILDKDNMEKCYGVAKAGKNDCADRQGKHSCAGQATKNGNADEWLYLPTGICNKISGSNS